MSAPSASTSSRAASGSKRMPRDFGLGGDPADGVDFSDTGQLDQAAGVAQRLADALVALFVLIVHAAQVGGDAEVVGDEEQDGLRVGAAEVGVDGGEFGLPGAAAVEQLEVAHEEHLEGSHQRWRLRAVEDLEDGGLGEVEVVKREVARGLRSQRGQHSLTAALVEECLVAQQDVAGAQGRGRGDLGEKAVGRCEAAERLRRHACVRPRYWATSLVCGLGGLSPSSK